MIDYLKIFYAGMLVESNRISIKKWKEKNPKYSTEYYRKNKLILGMRANVRYHSDVRVRDKMALWRHNNREKCRLRAKNYRLRNRDACAARIEVWRKNNMSKVCGYVKRYSRKPHIRCHLRVTKAMKSHFGRGRSFRKWSQILGYSAEQLRDHLESLFTEGMTWDRFMTGEIHIDHIKAKSKFIFTSETDPEFIACWSLRNLQPLWAIDNIKKGAK